MAYSGCAIHMHDDYPLDELLRIELLAVAERTILRVMEDVDLAYVSHHR